MHSGVYYFKFVYTLAHSHVQECVGERVCERVRKSYVHTLAHGHALGCVLFEICVHTIVYGRALGCVIADGESKQKKKEGKDNFGILINN